MISHISASKLIYYLCMIMCLRAKQGQPDANYNNNLIKPK